MTRSIPLGGSKHPGLVAIVDDDDYDDVARFAWRPRDNGHTFYARRTIHHPDGRTTTELLHRRILGLGPRELGDHRNGDGLDCRRSNLRSATDRQNSQNRQRRSDAKLRFKGIRIDRRFGYIEALIRDGGRSIYLGRFRSEEEAARAYDAKARELFGSFARCNFPLES